MLLFVDKPRGFTSFDVVSKIKRIYRWEKVWHAGTLDPNASWLLIVAVGKDTKRLHWLIWKEKSYETTIDFLQWSDTRDCEQREWRTGISQSSETLSPDNQLLAQKRWRESTRKRVVPSIDQIDQYCSTLLGNNELPLTPFSAKKVDWKKLYEYARSWQPIHKNVPMKVIDYTILDYSFPKLTLSFTVWSGTYIRSLGHVIWNHFGLWWILTSLRRTSIWKYSVDQLK